jgi:electron transport complex protein RnfB
MSYSIISACTGCTACVKVCPVGAIGGERKALHVIDPAVCINCGACGRICPSQAVLDEAHEVCQMVKRSLWLRPVILEIRCVSCGVCLQVCPTGVLDFAELTDHRVRTVAWLKDAPDCIGCSFCEAACPVEAIEMNAAQPE